MELALRSDESEEDMTAALTAPRPMKETKGGVRCCSTIGSTSDWWSLSRGSGPLYSVSFQASFSVTVINQFVSGNLENLELTGDSGHCADNHRRNSHDDAAKGGHVGEHLRLHGRLGGEHSLEVDLPRDATQHEQQSVVEVLAHLVGVQVTEPVVVLVRHALHRRVHQREGNAQPLQTNGHQIVSSKVLSVVTYQANKDASELNDVSVGDRVEPAEKRVEEGNRRGENDGGVVVHIDDDADGGAQSGENGRRPEDLTAKGGQKEQSAHPRAQRLLKWVQHCDVALFADLRCKEEAANDETERIAKGRLAPDDARGVDHLGGAVDVPAAYPSSCKEKLRSGKFIRTKFNTYQSL